MPNQYSHAIVLSNYGSEGLIDFHSSRPSKSTYSTGSFRSSASSAESRAQPSLSTHQSSICGPAQRLRLGSPTRPRSQPVRPHLHRKSSSIETQIYAPLHSTTPPPTRDAHSFEPNGHKPDYNTSSYSTSEHSSLNKTQFYTPHERYFSLGSPPPPLTQSPKEGNYFEIQEPTLPRPLLSEPKTERPDRSSTEIRGLTPQHLPHVKQHSTRRHSSAVAAGGKSYSSSETIRASAVRRENDSQILKGFGRPLRIPHNRYGRVPFAAQPFAPARPPSPPATPDSDKSFSLKTPIERPDPITTPPPIPERSARRSPPGPSPKQSAPTSPKHSVPTSPMSALKSELPRPMTSPAPKSPKSPTGTTFSITTRTSSLKAATTPPSGSQTFSLPSEPVFDDDSRLDSLHGTFDMPSQPFPVDDSDLESLPSTYAPSSPDFNIEPWSDDNAGPAIFRDCELNSLRPSTAGPESTRASSFDSAAPPPIGMNRPTPSLLTEITSSDTPKTSKSHKKAKPSLASLAFFRSTPRAILYSQTRAATPPVPVTASRTAAPSIPALFPSYKGPFPPPERTDEHSSRTSSDANRPKQIRGRSVTPKDSGRRRSWFRADPVERSFSLSQQPNMMERN